MDGKATTGTVEPKPNSESQTISEQTPTKTKKNGIIIGAVAACVIVLIGVIVAIVLNLPKREANAFEKSIDKLFNQSEARNVRFDGYAKLTPSDTSSPVSDINFNFEGEFAGTPLIGDVKLSTELKLNGGQIISPEAELITTNAGDYYLKLGGLAQSISKLAGFSYEMLPKDHPVASLIDKIDNKWVSVSADDMKELMSSADNEEASGAITCLSEYASGMNRGGYFSEVKRIYEKYPYLSASQENIAIAKKANPIYRVVFDKENLAKASKELAESEQTKNFLNCINATTDTQVEPDLSTIPVELYIEIDDNYNITRGYISAELDGMKMIEDINFSYPDVVNIAEPTEYGNFIDIFEEFTKNMSTSL